MTAHQSCTGAEHRDWTAEDAEDAEDAEEGQEQKCSRVKTVRRLMIHRSKKSAVEVRDQQRSFSSQFAFPRPCFSSASSASSAVRELIEMIEIQLDQ